MNAIFTCLAVDGNLRFYNKYDLERYCIENDNVELIVTLRPSAKVGPKMKLYAYYHHVILDCAVQGWRQTGDILDKVEADFRLRAEFAKTFKKSLKNEFIAVLEEKHTMTKPRLLQYIQDCIFFIESELQQEIPDSAEYKVKKETGKNFRKAGNGTQDT
jgi:hypothetical protein